MKRKILSLALVFMMLFAALPGLVVGASPSYPDGLATPQAITIDNSANSSLSIVGRTFSAIRVFDLLTFDADGNPTATPPTPPSYQYKLTTPFAGLDATYGAFLTDYLKLIASDTLLTEILTNGGSVSTPGYTNWKKPTTYSEFLQLMHVYRGQNSNPELPDTDLELYKNNDDWGVLLTQYVQDYINGPDKIGGTADDVNVSTVTKSATASAETVTINTTATGDFGYYFIASVADVKDASGQNSLKPVTAITALRTNDYPVTIKLKADAPIIDKQVSKVSTWAEAPFVNDPLTSVFNSEYTDVNIGDTVNYRISSKMPNMNGYDRYTFTVWDELGGGLTYVENATNLKVMIGSVDVTANVTLTYSTTGAAGSYKTWATLTGYTAGTPLFIKIDFNNFIQYKPATFGGGNNTATFNPGTAITITYNAKLNEKAMVAHYGNDQEGNPNKAKLEYSNNPYDTGDGTTTPGSTNETPEIEVKVFTFEVDIYKYTEDKTNNNAPKPLSGVEFNLYKDTVSATPVTTLPGDPPGSQYLSNFTWHWDSGLKKVVVDGGVLPLKFSTATGNIPVKDSTPYITNDGTTAYTANSYIHDTAGLPTLVTSTGGVINLYGLEAGTYWLVETKTVDGYNMIEKPIKIRIRYTGDGDRVVTSDAINLDAVGIYMADKNGVMQNMSHTAVGNIFADVAVCNESGVRFPETGGIGRTIFYIAGSLIVFGSVVALAVYMKVSSRKEKGLSK